MSLVVCTLLLATEVEVCSLSLREIARNDHVILCKTNINNGRLFLVILMLKNTSIGEF